MNHSFQIKNAQDYQVAYRKSIEAPELFWATVAATFSWRKPWARVLRWDFRKPEIAWFEGAQLNITENCLDRHLQSQGDKPALIWEPNNPSDSARTFSYRQLAEAVNECAWMLRNNGVQKGDRVCIYMGMVPELAIALLACARIGAIHSVIFGGFSAQSIADRVHDAQAAFLITADGSYRGNKEIPLKEIVDEALGSCPFVKHVFVYRRTGTVPNMQPGRDLFWDEEVAKVHAAGSLFFPAEVMDAEDPLFILYTSGSTGKPKGVVHTCAGYMVWTTYTFVNVFQIRPDDVHFCTADIGWITGHSYIVYGPLCAGATSLMFEGVPTWPDAGRFWDIIARHGASIFYTSPTAIRSLMAHGLSFLKGKDFSSLRVLGSVGEPINEEAWHWLDEQVGHKKCPIVDTWWQTETGGIMISNLAGVTPSRPGFATLPLPGVKPVLMNEKGQPILGNNLSGNLCLAAPWPGMIRSTWGDPQRCREAYFTAYPGYYFSGDGSLRNEKGFYRITGRVDDVLNVSGHRLGAAEIENAIGQCPGVVESAVVGFPHDLKGQGIYAFVISSSEQDASLYEAILNTVTDVIGAIARPDKIQFVRGLPKTRSGKIMRRILRKIAEGDMEHIGDITTLLEPAVVDEIKAGRA
ncbi:MAG: acetate--CoA ligase [Bacteroidetes bacterium]|nr:acetate--CoA ligase [Bacteroidota bacterium]